MGSPLQLYKEVIRLTDAASRRLLIHADRISGVAVKRLPAASLYPYCGYDGLITKVSSGNVLQMKRYSFLATILLIAFVSWAEASEMLLGWRNAFADGAPIKIRSKPTVLKSGKFSGLTLQGAWILESDNDDFGALSGMLIKDRHLYAVSDQGYWFSANLNVAGDNLRLDDAHFVRMRDAGGDLLTENRKDAEGLAWLNNRLAVSFERLHRVMTLHDSGRLVGLVEPQSFQQLPSNQGLEALATLPNGHVLALPEYFDDSGLPVFLIDPNGLVSQGRLPINDNHVVTGADVGPDGYLYLVLRLTRGYLGFGRSIRVMRFDLGNDGFPLAATGKTLAAFESGSGIENMEAIALERGRDGILNLWLLSDDNLSYWQNTMLMRLTVDD